MCLNYFLDNVPSGKFFSIGILRGYELKWHKKSTKDGSGKCNAYKTNNNENEIIGVIFEIDDCDKEKLDKKEGQGKGYNDKCVEIVTENGLVIACTYIADQNYIDDSLKPYTWYKDFVVSGAKQFGIPKEYIDNLESFEADKDPDEERENRKRKLLPC